MAFNAQKCPVCGGRGVFYKLFSSGKYREEYTYYLCENCNCYFIDTSVLDRMDKGEFLIQYDESYWKTELTSAVARSYGPALARMAEAIHYARRPVEKFLDIGTGSGYFLDAIAAYLPEHKSIFYGVEKYPPEEGKTTESPNYFRSDYKDLNMKFDCGMCVEVIEHLTPKMLHGLLKDVAGVSNPGALYIINSGLSDYVAHEDPDYLDPFVRGHIISWSINGIKSICKDLGFSVFPIRGKTWAIAIEYKSTAPLNEDITDRIWSALSENLEILTSEKMGSVLKILGLESVRAYL